MNKTCIIFLHINRFLYYPASLVGYRCQTTSAVLNKVATAHQVDYWDWQYGQDHQRYTENHSPCWIAAELFCSLSNRREKLLIHLYLKKSKPAVPTKAAVFKLIILIFLSHCTHIAIFLPVSRSKRLSHSFWDVQSTLAQPKLRSSHGVFCYICL